MLLYHFYFEHKLGTSEHLVRLDISKKYLALSALYIGEKTHTEIDSSIKDMCSLHDQAGIETSLFPS